MTPSSQHQVRARNSRTRAEPLHPGVTSTPDLALSVLDLVPVRSDQTTADALAATRGLARTADDLGYHRYWVAEHHNMPAVAATNPPVLVAMVAAATERIRVGSGGVMLPNHAPARRGRAVRPARGRPPRPDRPRHRTGTGHRPGHELRAAPRRRAASTDDAVDHFPEYVDNVLDDDGPTV